VNSVGFSIHKFSAKRPCSHRSIARGSSQDAEEFWCLFGDLLDFDRLTPGEQSLEVHSHLGHIKAANVLINQPYAYRASFVRLVIFGATFLTCILPKARNRRAYG